MNSKLGTIGALSAGGITIGAVATVSVMLLTGGSPLSEMSDKEALEQGFTQIFESDETSNYLNLLENIEGKPLSTSFDVTINNIMDKEELFGANFGYTLDSATEELLLTIYGSSPKAPFEGDLSASMYLSPEMLAFTSNAISKYITINVDTFLEDYNNSYLATITGPIDTEALKEEGLDSEQLNTLLNQITEGVNAIDTDQLNKNLQAQLDEDIDILMDNLSTTRSDDTYDINGLEAYKINVSVDSSYLLKIAYNQIIEFFAEKSVQQYINEMYPEITFMGKTYEDTSSALMAALTFGYGTFEESFKKTFGSTLELDVFFTEDAKICRILLPVSLDKTVADEVFGFDEGDNVKIALYVDFLGDDDIYDEYKVRFEANVYDEANTFVGTAYIEASKDIDNDTTIYKLVTAEEEDDIYEFSLSKTLTDSTFKNIFTVSNNGANVLTSNFNGTYKLTDNSLEVNATKITFEVLSVPYIDMMMSFSIAENTTGIEKPSDNCISLTDMTLEDIMNIAEEYGLFLGEEGYGELAKQTIEETIAMKQLKEQAIIDADESSQSLEDALREYYKSTGMSDEEIEELLNK